MPRKLSNEEATQAKLQLMDENSMTQKPPVKLKFIKSSDKLHIYSIYVDIKNMDRQTAIKVLSEWDSKGRYVFTLHDLAKLFPDDKPKTLQEGVNRLVRSGLLQRACRGVYVYTLARSVDSYTIERVTQALRRGEYNYISLESALSEYGAISQIPIDRLTVMTTGRKGSYSTPWGMIEFTHTKRAASDIVAGIQTTNRPLRMATPQVAWRDLKRVGRNTHLVDEEALLHD